MIEQVNDGIESNDDEAPPELEPQSPALQKVIQRSSGNKHNVHFYIILNLNYFETALNFILYLVS